MGLDLIRRLNNRPHTIVDHDNFRITHDPHKGSCIEREGKHPMDKCRALEASDVLHSSFRVVRMVWRSDSFMKRKVGWK